MMSKIYIFFIIIMTLFGALGGMFLKKASNKEKKLNFTLFIGLGLYGCGAILNIILLKFVPLTIIFPSNALTYIWSMFIGYFVFDEKLTLKKITGIFFISLGLYVLVL